MEFETIHNPLQGCLFHGIVKRNRGECPLEVRKIEISGSKNVGLMGLWRTPAILLDSNNVNQECFLLILWVLLKKHSLLIFIDDFCWHQGLLVQD